jgi:hypothetical protein
MNLFEFLTSNPINSGDPMGLFSLGDVQTASAYGAKIDSGYDAATQAFSMFKDFAAGVSMQSILFDAALSYAGNATGGAMLDRLVGVAGPLVNIARENVGKILQMHHMNPKFLGGVANGKTLPFLSPFHKMLHDKLRAALKAAGLTPKLQGFKKGNRAWSTKNFGEILKDPKNRTKLNDVLEDVYSEMDEYLGIDVLLNEIRNIIY